MNNSKKTRRALLSSVIALALCFSMFVGTTMAWFTDTATTGVNTIKAGTLDIDLLMDKEVDGNYVSIAGKETGIFTKADVATNSTATLWEPGKTQVAYLAIKNDGNLAAKYSVDILAVKPADATADMTKVMQYAITPDATKDAKVTSWTTGSSLDLGTTRATTDVAIDAGATHYFALSVHMDEEAGNEYQGQSVEFYISVTATQKDKEADSFGTTYDEKATYEATLAAGTATGTVDANKAVTEAFEVEAKNAKNEVVAVLSVPAGAKLEDENGNVSITVTPTDLHEEVEVTSEQGAKTYDVEVTGLEDGQTVTVELYVGTGLTGLKLYHEDTEIVYDNYDATYGIVTFTTNSFSPYTVVYNAAKDLPYAEVNVLTDLINKSTADLNWNTSHSMVSKDSGVKFETAYEFKATDSEEVAAASKYAKYHADFAVKFNKDIEGTEGIGIAGEYGSFGWIGFLANEDLFNGLEIEKLEKDVYYDLLGSFGFNMNYEELCSLVKVFNCSAWGGEGAEGTTMTVELRLYETEEPSAENGNSWNVRTGDYVVIGRYTHTFDAE